jgi:hypothetical protein
MGRKRKSPVINATQMDGDESISNDVGFSQSGDKN